MLIEKIENGKRFLLPSSLTISIIIYAAAFKQQHALSKTPQLALTTES